MVYEYKMDNPNKSLNLNFPQHEQYAVKKPRFVDRGFEKFEI